VKGEKYNSRAKTLTTHYSLLTAHYSPPHYLTS